MTGGAGFVGSHLVDKLMLDGHEVNVPLDSKCFLNWESVFQESRRVCLMSDMCCRCLWWTTTSLDEKEILNSGWDMKTLRCCTMTLSTHFSLRFGPLLQTS